MKTPRFFRDSKRLPREEIRRRVMQWIAEVCRSWSDDEISDLVEFVRAISG